ncbi:MAG: hypothetical protein IE909_03220 [Campylobacterales bacterium]|nr:hypothetical protein [Campylobacterales bacterium]
MTREIFIKKLEVFQSSQAPVEVKEKAILRLKEEFFNYDQSFKHKEILNDIARTYCELKSSELR